MDAGVGVCQTATHARTHARTRTHTHDARTQNPSAPGLVGWWVGRQDAYHKGERTKGEDNLLPFVRRREGRLPHAGVGEATDEGVVRLEVKEVGLPIPTQTERQGCEWLQIELREVVRIDGHAREPSTRANRLPIRILRESIGNVLLSDARVRDDPRVDELAAEDEGGTRLVDARGRGAADLAVGEDAP